MKPFVFIHIPKTAGISMSEALRDVCEARFHIAQFDDPISTGKGLYIGHLNPFLALGRSSVFKYYCDRAFKFCFVRNPWDRVVSLYEWLKGKGTIGDVPFEAFLCELRDDGIVPVPLRNAIGNSQCNQQTAWTHRNGKCAVDFVGRFESLQSDFNIVCDKVGITRRDLPRNNTTNRSDYRDYYNAFTKDLVSKLYSEDINCFEYSY